MGVFFASAAILTLIAPLPVLAIAFIPLRLEKNTFAIRWGFLFKIYKRSGDIPPHVKDWLR
jgi:hypothetical protein